MRIVPFKGCFGWLDGNIDDNPANHHLLRSFRLEYREKHELDLVEAVGGVRIGCPTPGKQIQIRVLSDGEIFIKTV